jgi:transposase-like protein
MAAAGNVIHIERVRCLDCSASYSKPAGGGTVHENPGCPRCGYLGWIATTVPTGPEARDHSAEDLRPSSSARRR